MKEMILPVLLLVGVIVFVIWSGWATESSLEALIDQTKALPDEISTNTPEFIEMVEKQWSTHKELYSSIIKFDFVYNFSKEISAAKAGAEADDPGTYLAAKKSMINILEYIRDVQRLRFDNII